MALRPSEKGLQGDLRALDRYALGQDHLQPELQYAMSDLDFGYPVTQSRLMGSLGQPSSRILDNLGDSLLHQRALEHQLKLQQEQRLLGAIKTLDKQQQQQQQQQQHDFASFGAGAVSLLAHKDDDVYSPRKRSGEPLSPSMLDQTDILGTEDQTTTGERRVRMREKNRNAQRRYRERQKAQISRMQAEIDELTDKLQRSEEEKAITLEQNKMLIREMQQMQQQQSKRHRMNAMHASGGTNGGTNVNTNTSSGTNTATNTVASPPAAGSNTDA